MSTPIYHMAQEADWAAALVGDGSYAGSADDRRDGFIHFSAGALIAGSAASTAPDRPTCCWSAAMLKPSVLR